MRKGKDEKEHRWGKEMQIRKKAWQKTEERQREGKNRKEHKSNPIKDGNRKKN